MKRKGIKIAAVLVVIVGVFAWIFSIDRNPEVKYDPLDGLAMARSYFKNFNDIGLGNEFSRELVSQGTQPLIYLKRISGKGDIKAVIVYASYKPLTFSSAFKDFKLGVPVQESKLSVDTFVVTDQHVECFADMIGKTKKLHTHFVFGDGHLDQWTHIDIAKGLNQLSSLQPNDHIRAFRGALIVQTGKDVRVYSVENKGTMSDGCHTLIPYIPF